MPGSNLIARLMFFKSLHALVPILDRRNNKLTSLYSGSVMPAMFLMQSTENDFLRDPPRISTTGITTANRMPISRQWKSSVNKRCLPFRDSVRTRAAPNANYRAFTPHIICLVHQYLLVVVHIECLQRRQISFRLTGRLNALGTVST